jgi:molybdopterin converting factor small subunit
VKVRIATPLHSYTGGAEVEAEGPSVAALLDDLERRYPGIRFRIVDEQGRVRPHMRVFVNREAVRSLDTPLAPGDDVQILQALSGG